MKKRILLVEDDPNFGLMLKSFLEIKGFDVSLCKDGSEAIKRTKNNIFDLYILDVMLPNKDGFSIAKDLMDDKTPFIFLTARSLKEDVIKGYNLGAIDYLVKPFDPEILYLKIQAFIKAEKITLVDEDYSNNYSIGSFELDNIRQLLKTDHEEIKLTHKECELLKLLIEKKEDILLRSEALNYIWGSDNYFTTKSMDVYITRLRKFLKKDNSFTIEIQNIRSKGFRLIVFPIEET